MTDLCESDFFKNRFKLSLFLFKNILKDICISERHASHREF